MTKRKLKKASEHIYYEIWMFYQTLLLLLTPRNHIEVNILLDAFAIHARSLLDFFYPKRMKVRRPDDMFAYHYSSNLFTFKQNKTMKKDLLFVARKADKQVAHLTYTRNRYGAKTKPWPHLSIGKKMHKTIKAFYNSLSDQDKKWSYFVELKKQIDLNDNLLN